MHDPHESGSAKARRVRVSSRLGQGGLLCLGGWAWLGFWVLVALGGAYAGFGSAWGATFRDTEYLIDSWETDQGLPENSATAMVQTPEGYLWFGTFNGLVRFDGVRFTVFDPSNTPGLPSAGIVNLHLDAAQRMWVSTYRGLVVSDPGRWTAFKPVPEFSGDYVRSFAERDGVMVLTSFDGKVFIGRGGDVEAIPPPPEGRPRQGYVGAVDRQGVIWLSQTAGQYFGHWTGQAWKTSPLKDRIHPGFVGLTTGPEGDLRVVTRREVLRLEGAEIRLAMPIRSERVLTAAWRVGLDRQGALWIAGDGLHRVLPTGEVRSFDTTTGLTYDALRFVLEDREGNLWVGSSGGGLMRFKTRVFRTFVEEGTSKARNMKAVLEEAPGRMLFGSYQGGLHRWKDGSVEPLPGAEQPQSAWVQCLLRDRSGNRWVGGYAAAPAVSPLTVFTPTGRMPVPAGTGGRSIESLFEDSHGRIWIGGSTSLVRYEAGSFQPETHGIASLMKEVHAMAEDVAGDILWAANSEGLFARRGGVWEEVRLADHRPVKDALCLKVHPDGSLWVGGVSGGLLRLRNGVWSAIGIPQGIPVRHVANILEDGLGYWWMGSNRGILRASIRQLEAVADGRAERVDCLQFDLADGLASVECSMEVQTSAARSSDGRLWFATLKGVAVVDPSRVPLNTLAPTVRIEEIRVEDSRGEQRLIPVAGPTPIEVAPDTRELSVYLAGLSFTAPEKMRFAYRLEGVDGKWRDLGGQRSLYFSKPAPGRYRLLARASNNDGLWSEAAAVVAFHVQPHFWQAGWFRGLAVLVLGGGLGALLSALQRNRLRRAEERLAQQQALATERARTAAMVQHASDAILLLDRQGQVLFQSPSASRILGVDLSLTQARHPFDHVHPEDQERIRADLQGVIERTHHGSPVQFRLRDAGGAWRHLEAVGDNLLDQKGVEGVLITARDVTERKRAEAEKQGLQNALIEAQRMEAIGRLAGGVAHDFNNILTAMVLNLGLLQAMPGLSGDAQAGVEELQEEARRASDLTRQLLLFSRRQPLQSRCFELHALIQHLLNLLRRLLGERVLLDFQPHPGDFWLHADSAMLERVIMNLVINARDAMPQGGRIRLTTDEVSVDTAQAARHPGACAGRYIRLSVADTGMGMDEATRQRVFEPFFTTKSAGKGTGLGLASVYGIVQQHQGWLEVESAPALGSVFHVFLPAAEPPTESADSGEASPSKLPGGTETILLVEDSERLRHVAAITLRRLGYRVLEAGSGPDALRVWQGAREDIALLLTDMVMPGDLTGRELGIRLHAERPSLKCLLMSGYSPELMDGSPLLPHEGGFIPKPFAASVLAERVRRCLDDVGAADPQGSVGS